MQSFVRAFATVLVLAPLLAASPIPYPEASIAEMESLRAHGTSEVKSPVELAHASQLYRR